VLIDYEKEILIVLLCV